MSPRPPLLTITHTVKQDVLNRDGDITCGTLGWEGVGHVGKHICGEGAAYPEACEDHFLLSCRAIGGGPLVQDGFDGVEIKVVPVILPQEFY
ncbi:hypothetical protein E2C01_066425 [Portunus trituberculatus]|uniref:Uncharacterized protein n=1 Tax=Portunus trituberculatus TaxID=210409 RepID=A0A5B7HH15_PORTR|nr:hypothetical protein [Portunus trituberculatus]